MIYTIYTKLRALVISLTFICTVQTFAAVAHEFTRDPKSAIRVKISETAPTRINFGKLQITEVIGDENKYKSITDTNGRNVFITPKVAADSIIPMTLIASSNHVQDLLLEVSSEEKLPHAIIIASDSSKEDGDKSLYSTKSETELLLHAMLDDENPHDKYYVSQTKRKLILPHLPKLRVTQDKTWRYKNLTGVSLTITNKGRVAANIQSQSLRSLFKNTKCIVIDSNLLAKGDSTKAFIITEEEE